ncbi:hypothetical protein [Paracoccus sp. SCSIO 75233]|uniref:hypothetical protein n=1 Tax=Paracoccus sp. SCSIO 75233 TaxID=3017782 RepID=UPI0022F104A8|nr:hypothetical protein [Paracoccus sp. SCSIO 75233]WBU51778.1 hypothetical protein PAF12_07920 [Paracoccus sp. SCSIO 75233]
MSDNVTNELILEHLKAMHRRMDDLAHKADETNARIAELNDHMHGAIGSLNRHDAGLVALTARVERIERRLELSEGEAWS